jgi:hypothetical protein
VPAVQCLIERVHTIGEKQIQSFPLTCAASPDLTAAVLKQSGTVSRDFLGSPALLSMDEDGQYAGKHDKKGCEPESQSEPPQLPPCRNADASPWRRLISDNYTSL